MSSPEEISEIIHRVSREVQLTYCEHTWYPHGWVLALHCNNRIVKIYKGRIGAYTELTPRRTILWCHTQKEAIPGIDIESVILWLQTECPHV